MAKATTFHPLTSTCLEDDQIAIALAQAISEMTGEPVSVLRGSHIEISLKPKIRLNN